MFPRFDITDLKLKQANKRNEFKSFQNHLALTNEISTPDPLQFVTFLKQDVASGKTRTATEREVGKSIHIIVGSSFFADRIQTPVDKNISFETTVPLYVMRKSQIIPTLKGLTKNLGIVSEEISTDKYFGFTAYRVSLPLNVYRLESIIAIFWTYPSVNRKGSAAAQSWEKTWPFTQYNGLTNLVKYGWMIGYHGTTADFDQFNLNYARQQLVNDFYGSGFFFVPKESIAWDYAYANRNAGLPVSVIDDIAKTKPNFAVFLRLLYENGYEKGWKLYTQRVGLQQLQRTDFLIDGVDMNVGNDIYEHIEGRFWENKQSPSLHDLFSGSTAGVPEFVYKELDALGVDSNKYKPKVYSVAIRGVKNVLTTASLEEARQARAKGYDAVIYHGEKAVRGVPEIAVWDPSKLTIIKKEVFDDDDSSEQQGSRSIVKHSTIFTPGNNRHETAKFVGTVDPNLIVQLPGAMKQQDLFRKSPYGRKDKEKWQALKQSVSKGWTDQGGSFVIVEWVKNPDKPWISKLEERVIEKFGDSTYYSTDKELPAEIIQLVRPSDLQVTIYNGNHRARVAQQLGIPLPLELKFFGGAERFIPFHPVLSKLFPQGSPNKFFDVNSISDGVDVLNDPIIVKNWKKSLKVKPKHRTAVLVPCASTKPFPQAPSHQHGYLEGLQGKKVDVYVVSEPLGIVPYKWSRSYPNDAYDFPPKYLKGEGRKILVDRFNQWGKKVGSKYGKIYLALPGHHMKLVKDAAIQGTDLSITACRLDSCSPRTFRATTQDYVNFLRRKIR